MRPRSREMRDLTRARTQFVREIFQHSLRLQKLLGDANLKLGSAMPMSSAAVGAPCSRPSSWAKTTPRASLAQGTARKRRAELRERY